MVFKEIENDQFLDGEFVRFNPRGTIKISTSLLNKYWSNVKFVQIYHDEENKLVGFKPSEKLGYLLNRGSRIVCSILTNVVTGTFKATWNEKTKMLVVSYGKGT